jgi:ABC-type Na+ efflux pump permease subunit
LQGRYPGVENAIDGIMADLSVIIGEVGPSKVDDQYVAFYRAQAERVALVEQRINRVESALKPIERTVRFGFKVKPPSEKTTWALIYIILGFLGLFSVLFFLRWFGKSKGEKMGV